MTDTEGVYLQTTNFPWMRQKDDGTWIIKEVYSIDTNGSIPDFITRLLEASLSLFDTSVDISLPGFDESPVFELEGWRNATADEITKHQQRMEREQRARVVPAASTLVPFTTSECPDPNCPGQGAYHEHTVYMEVHES